MSIRFDSGWLAIYWLICPMVSISDFNFTLLIPEITHQLTTTSIARHFAENSDTKHLRTTFADQVDVQLSQSLQERKSLKRQNNVDSF